MYSCKYCKKEFSKKNSMHRHIKNNCKVIKTMNEQNISKIMQYKRPKKIKSTICYGCNKKFKNSHNMIRHTKYHCKVAKMVEK